MLDIGANIGWYSLLVHSINKSSSIHAFEPIPNTFKRLSDNCSINQANAITCHNFGFSSEPGSFPFYFYPEGSGNASIRNLAGREDAQVIECELKTLGDFCLDLPPSSLIGSNDALVSDAGSAYYVASIMFNKKMSSDISPQERRLIWASPCQHR